VDAVRDARAEGGDDLVEEVDVLEGGGADHRALGSGPQRVAHRVHGAQPAAVLHGHAGTGDDPPQMLERPRLARLGAVEVDDVEDARARVHPAPGGLERVVVVDGAVLEAALDEAHRLPLEDVDGRVEDHAATRAQTAVKLRSSASPSREDFSGWNCTPDTVPRSTIEAKRSPYSATPTTSAGSAGRQANECTW